MEFRRPRRFMPPLGAPKPSARQSVLAMWRGVDLAPAEVAAGQSAKPADGVMKQVLSGLRMDRRQGEAEIVRVWNHLIQPDVVEHAQPTGINKGTLFVTVDSSVWLDEIVRYRRKDILKRLQYSFGRELIQRISFRLG